MTHATRHSTADVTLELDLLQRIDRLQQILWDLWRSGHVDIDQIRALGPMAALEAELMERAANGD